jgi:uncharacterized protein YcgL (UPF0745 family)
VELTNRAQLNHISCLIAMCPASPCVCAAANAPGFLATCYENNSRIQQSVSHLSSMEFVSGLFWCEVAATPQKKLTQGAADAGSNDFKKALQTLAITVSGAHGSSHTCMVRWRSSSTSGTVKTTIFNIGFSPEELKTAFVDKATNMMATLRGFKLLDHALTVSNVIEQQGFRFYVPIPEGWTDETLLQAMIEQAGLDPDHVLSFGVELLKKSVCNAPSGDMWFNFAPAGCLDHGSKLAEEFTGDPATSIMQPPSHFFVTLPDGTESHCKVRKAGACQACWLTPGRHPNCPYKDVCKMCLVRWEDMEGSGKRHACCQGDMFRAKTRGAFNPNMGTEGAEESSDLAQSLKERMLENIRNAKRKREEAAAADWDEGWDNYGPDANLSADAMADAAVMPAAGAEDVNDAAIEDSAAVMQEIADVLQEKPADDEQPAAKANKSKPGSSPSPARDQE